MADCEVLLQSVGALGVLLNGFSVLQLLTPFESTGPLIKTVIEILNDISGYVKVLVVLLFAFSISFAVAMPKNDVFVNGTTGPLAGLLTSFEAIVGSFHMRDFQNSESTAFFLLYLFGMVVIMLNLLIAIMADSYEKVKESEVVEARKLRAQTIIDEEALMNDKDRSNPDYFPRYLQVLRATEGKEEVWAGLSGKMVSEILKVEDKLVETERGLNRRVEEAQKEIQKEMRHVEEAQKEIQREMRKEIEAVHTGMAELKEMMRLLLEQKQ